MILIRADANENTGSGHVMRCLSIASAFKAKGETVIFVAADNKSYDLVTSKGFDCEILDTDFSDLEGELNKLISIISLYNPSLFIVDSYFVTGRYFAELGKNIKTAYIDDLNFKVWDVDYLINYNIFSSEYDYSGYKFTKTKLLLTPEYAPLRDEFRNLPPHDIKDNVTDVLVSAGGSDPARISERIINEICPMLPDIRFHFIIGALNPRIDVLKKLERDNVILHINEQHIADLMRKCDMAVSASGSTLYELCACGVPTIVFTLADNQIPAADMFDKMGIMLNSGDCRFDEKFILNLESCIRKLIPDTDIRNKMSYNMQHLVDGRGAERLAERLLS